MIKVKKYFCSNNKCQHTTFAEPLDFVERNAIRTKRLDNYINNIELKTSSVEAEKQIKETHVNISNNTIFVDNDKKKKVEVINSREKDDVVEKLKLFKKVKIVTKDFSQTYKNAIKEALPKAKQIIDRFHIFKNLTDDLNNYIKRTIADTIKIIDNKEKEIKEEKRILNRRQQNKKDSAERKWKVIQEVQQLYKEGYNKSEISRILLDNLF